QSYSVSAAAWTPTYPPPPRTYRENASCCPGSSTSPVVDSQTTAAYRASVAGLNRVGSSVATTLNPSRVASRSSAAMAAGIESCRNPAVRLNTSTANSPSGGGALDGAAPHPAASTTARPTRRRRVNDMYLQ